METQIRLSRHNKFISAENIVGIFSVSSEVLFGPVIPSGQENYSRVNI